MNTVHMNKLTCAASSLVDSFKIVLSRGSSLLCGEKYDLNVGPQWQQLELPFSRTPVKKWNR